MRAIVTLTAILVLSALKVAGANQATGSVSGIVTDTSGQGLPGARIRLSDANGRVREAVTDWRGRYELGALPPGRYRIEAGLAGFETKVSAVSVRADETVDWTGALLVGPPVVGEASIEQRVRRETGWDAVDCGRYRAPAMASRLEASLACAHRSAQLRLPFSIIVQATAGGVRDGFGLLAGSDGAVYRFEYRRGGLTFDLYPCPSPRVAPDGTDPGSASPVSPAHRRLRYSDSLRPQGFGDLIRGGGTVSSSTWFDNLDVPLRRSPPPHATRVASTLRMSSIP